MKPNDLTPSQRKWQKVAGYVLPILLGWFLFAWNFLLTVWVLDNPLFSKMSWLIIPIGISWLGLLPVSGYSTGILNAYCWKNQGAVSPRDSLILLTLLWLLPSPLLELPILIGYLVLCFFIYPIHLFFFWSGEEIGKAWIKDDAISRFLGRNNEWERDESDTVL